MYSPTLDDFLKLAAQGNVIPVTRRLLADIETPLSAYRKIRGQGESFLFESVEGGEHLGRYSFVGCNPRAVIRQTGDRVEVIENGKVVETLGRAGSRLRGQDGTARTRTVVAVVERVMKKYRAVALPGCRVSPAAPSASSVTNSFTTSSRSCRGRPRTNWARPQWFFWLPTNY